MMVSATLAKTITAPESQGTPPPGREPAVGEQQYHADPQQPHRGYPCPLGERVARHGIRSGAGGDGIPKDDEHPEEPRGQADPAYGVVGTPGGDQSAHYREGQEGQEEHQAAEGAGGAPVS